MSEFKVGDFVRHIDDNSVFKVIGVHDLGDELFYSDGYRTHRIIKLEQWQPKKGEWCWYDKKYFIKVKNIKDEQIYFSSLDGMYINDWDYLCKFEPFIGELPTFLKDSKLQN